MVKTVHELVIAEAEVARLREYAAGCEKTAMLNQQENVELKLELAAERAAREELDADWKRRHTEWLDKALVDAQWHRDQLQQAERERDAALARVAEVTEQRDLWAKQCNMASEAQADAASKLSTALAALKAGTSREVVAHAETLGKLRALELDREEFTQRDAAERMRLVKLVQELEAKNESLREECDLFSQDKVATEATLTRSREDEE